MTMPDGKAPCPLPQRTINAMKSGERQRYALATTTKPVSTVRMPV